MDPTLQEDNRVIVYKLGYMLKGPGREDIVILNMENTERGIIKNIINEDKDIIDNIKYRFTG